MKRTIKLTGRELKQMISESVKRVLRENEYLDAQSWMPGIDDDEWEKTMNKHGKLPKGYDKDLTVNNLSDYPSVDALAGLNKDYESEILPFRKDDEKEASWATFDLNNHYRYPRFNPNDPSYRNAYTAQADSQGKRFFHLYNSNIKPYTDWYGMDDEAFTNAEQERDSQNKTKSKVDKGIEAADKRPLHRKGSLNRELKESRINRVLNEDTIVMDNNWAQEEKYFVEPCKEICKMMLSEKWFSLLQRYGCKPTFSVEPYILINNDAPLKVVDDLIFKSNNIEELFDYIRKLKDNGTVSGVELFLRAEQPSKNAPKPIHEIYNELFDDFGRRKGACNVFNYEEAHKPKMDYILRKYVNNGLNNR